MLPTYLFLPPLAVPAVLLASRLALALSAPPPAPVPGSAPTLAPGETTAIPDGFNGLQWRAPRPSRAVQAAPAFQTDYGVTIFRLPSQPDTYFGVPIADVTYGFAENKLREVHLYFDVSQIDAIVGRLVEHWGRADTSSRPLLNWFTPSDSSIAFLGPAKGREGLQLDLFDGRFALDRMKSKEPR